MFPHERSLVKRMQNKPFALIGINSDTDPKYRQLKADLDNFKPDSGKNKEDLKKQLDEFKWDAFKVSLKEKNEAAQITWRSFWNGPDGTGGPISKTWNVSGWPTLYILDHKGVIRHKWLGNPGDAIMDKAIDDLVAEAEKESKGAN